MRFAKATAFTTLCLASSLLLFSQPSSPPASDSIPGAATDDIEALNEEEVQAYSYASGRKFGQTFAIHSIPLDTSAYMEGFRSLIDGEATKLTPDRAAALVEKVESNVRENAAAIAKEREASGHRFLQDYSSQPGVVRTSSGVAYRVIKPGDGEAVDGHEVVMMMLDARLPSGLEIAPPGVPGPMGFKLGDGQPGLNEALRLMRVGSVYEVVVPPNLAFGSDGSPEVPPNATLVFTVEVLGVTDPSKNRPDDPVINGPRQSLPQPPGHQQGVN